MRVWMAKAAIYLCAWLVALTAAVACTGVLLPHPALIVILFLGVKFSTVLLLGNLREMWRHTSLGRSDLAGRRRGRIVAGAPDDLDGGGVPLAIWAR